jgi:hypothetical protein
VLYGFGWASRTADHLQRFHRETAEVRRLCADFCAFSNVVCRSLNVSMTSEPVAGESLPSHGNRSSRRVSTISTKFWGSEEEVGMGSSDNAAKRNGPASRLASAGERHLKLRSRDRFSPMREANPACRSEARKPDRWLQGMECSSKRTLGRSVRASPRESPQSRTVSSRFPKDA